MPNQITIKQFSFSDSELERIWMDLEFKNPPFIFQTYNWCKNWYDKVGRYDDDSIPLVLVVYFKQDPVALFPLVLRQKRSLKIISFLGGDQSDYNSILHGQLDIEFQEVWDEVLRNLPKFDLISLNRIPEKIGVNDNVLCSLSGMVFLEEAHHIDFSLIEDEDHVVSKRSKKDIQRMMRRLSDHGVLEMRIAQSDKDFQKVIGHTLEQKERRYLDTGARNILSNPQVKNFYKTLFQLDSEDIKIHLSSLHLKGDILSTHLGFIYENRYYYIFPTFEEGNYVKYSPGRVLLYELVNISLRSGIQVFDMTIGSEDYKKKWSNGSLQIYDYYHCATFKGQVYMLIQSLIAYIKKSPRLKSYFLRINQYIRFY